MLSNSSTYIRRSYFLDTTYLFKTRHSWDITLISWNRTLRQFHPIQVRILTLYRWRWFQFLLGFVDLFCGSISLFLKNIKYTWQEQNSWLCGRVRHLHCWCFQKSTTNKQVSFTSTRETCTKTLRIITKQNNPQKPKLLSDDTPLSQCL